ncbi:MAG: DUF2325 domain-containing protein [Pseudomonadota bacterium]
MCEVSPAGGDTPDANDRPRKGRRLRPWQMRGNVACSVVGTCLSDRDLLEILKRLRLKTAENLPSFELHGYFVEALTQDCPVARTAQKVLDRRHEGILRLFGQTGERRALEALWRREFNAGRIPGAYWALQTFDHIPESLHVEAFGEVHMLSHILGRAINVDIERIDTLQAQIADLQSVIARLRRRHREVIAARDDRIADLEKRAIAAGGVPAVSAAPRPVSHPALETEKHTRALMKARERARAAETQNDELAREITRLRRSIQELERLNRSFEDADATCPGALACELNLPADERLRVLYLGGRTGSIEYLRVIAENASADLLHHDGGLQESFHKIAPMIEQCHVVFCPVDCVSHRACLFAKGECRRLRKGFVPLISAGQTTFARALDEIRR